MPDHSSTLLGLLSDTHGRADACRRALHLLVARGASAFVHSGDVGEEPVFDALAGHRVWFVWGNNDWEHDRLDRYARDLDLTCLNAWGRFEFAGKQFVVTHGDDGRRVAGLCDRAERASDDGIPDYLVTGHTHVFHDRRFGRMRWINPGALYRARPHTVALLDVTSDRLETIEVPPA